jgi:hypothetical protein
MAETQETPGLRLYSEDSEAIDELFRQALKKKGRSAYSEFLSFVTKFERFSIFNAMLIYAQRPGAAAVGTRHQWRGIERKINPDAVPIITLQPFAPVQFLYELQDTSGPPLPGEENSPLLAFGRVPRTEWDRTVSAATKSFVEIELVGSYGAHLAGTAAKLPSAKEAETVQGDGKKFMWRVRVNSVPSEATRFLSLTHELAHIYCGHLGECPKRRWPDRSKSLTHNQREIEAEAAAWLVCSRAGLETRSAEYLSGYVSEEDLKEISAFSIFFAAHRIEARGEKIKR